MNSGGFDVAGMWAGDSDKPGAPVGGLVSRSAIAAFRGDNQIIGPRDTLLDTPNAFRVLVALKRAMLWQCRWQRTPELSSEMS